MLDLNEDNISELDRIGKQFGCKLYFPPTSKGYLYPFFLRQELFSICDSTDFTSELMYSGFSFYSETDSEEIVIIGHTNWKK